MDKDLISTRMYRNQYPQVNDLVITQVREITDSGVYVSLLEYGGIQGMILLVNLSKKRIKSLSKFIKVGSTEIVSVIAVDEHKGYIDLSKKIVQQQDIEVVQSQYAQSRVVHSMVHNLANKLNTSMENYYVRVIWPILDEMETENAYEALQLLKKSGTSLTITVEDLKPLLTELEQRLIELVPTYQTTFEVVCYDVGGIGAIKNSLMKGLNVHPDVSIRLIASPLYAASITSEVGEQVLQNVVDVVGTEIGKSGGRLKIVDSPKIKIES